MNSNKVPKIVENYTLEEMQYIDGIGNEFWLVNHILSKKRYSMKKVGIKGLQAQKAILKPSLLSKEELVYNNLLRQVNILKSLNGESSPKCHKIIKTMNNYYLVYDLFPQMSIQAFLDQQKPANSDKLQILIDIARQLSGFHQKKIVLLNLDISSVHLSRKGKIFLKDWSMARNIEDEDIPLPGSSSRIRQFFAPEVRKGSYGFSSDVFSLGKLIGRMINRGEFEECLPQKQKLKEIAAKMIQIIPNMRPTIDSVISSLQLMRSINCVKDNPYVLHFNQFSSEKHLTQRSLNSTQSSDLSQNTSKMIFMTERNISQMNSQRKSFGFGEINKDVSKPNNLQKNLSCKGINCISQANLQRNNSSVSFGFEKKPCLEFVKSVCRRRSFVFFILSLAEFVMESNIVIELAYILIKYSRLSVISIMKDVEAKVQQQGSEDLNHLLELLKKQQRSISANQLKVKTKFVYKNLQPAMKCEFINDKAISDPLLSTKILEFGKRMIELCDQQIMDGNDAFDIEENLINTWFIFKKIEFGSYERFWKAEESQFINNNNKILEKIAPRDILEKINKMLNSSS